MHHNDGIFFYNLKLIMTISMAAKLKTTPNVACAARLLRRASRKASKAQCSAWLDWNDNCLILMSRSASATVYSPPYISRDLMKSSFVLWVIMALVPIFTSGSESESWYSCHSSRWFLFIFSVYLLLLLQANKPMSLFWPSIFNLCALASCLFLARLNCASI